MILIYRWNTHWLKEKKLDRSFGRGLSKTLKRTIKSRITEVERENQRLEYENSVLSAFKKKLYEFSGISEERSVDEAIRACQEKTIKQVDPVEILELRYLLSAMHDVLSGHWFRQVDNYMKAGFEVNYHGSRVKVEKQSPEVNPSHVLQELDRVLDSYPKTGEDAPVMPEMGNNIRKMSENWRKITEK